MKLRDENQFFENKEASFNNIQVFKSIDSPEYSPSFSLGSFIDELLEDSEIIKNEKDSKFEDSMDTTNHKFYENFDFMEEFIMQELFSEDSHSENFSKFSFFHNMKLHKNVDYMKSRNAEERNDHFVISNQNNLKDANVPESNEDEKNFSFSFLHSTISDSNLKVESLSKSNLETSTCQSHAEDIQFHENSQSECIEIIEPPNSTCQSHAEDIQFHENSQSECIEIIEPPNSTCQSHAEDFQFHENSQSECIEIIEPPNSTCQSHAEDFQFHENSQSESIEIIELPNSMYLTEKNENLISLNQNDDKKSIQTRSRINQTKSILNNFDSSNKESNTQIQSTLHSFFGIKSKSKSKNLTVQNSLEPNQENQNFGASKSKIVSKVSSFSKLSNLNNVNKRNYAQTFQANYDSNASEQFCKHEHDHTSMVNENVKSNDDSSYSYFSQSQTYSFSSCIDSIIPSPSSPLPFSLPSPLPSPSSFPSLTFSSPPLPSPSLLPFPSPPSSPSSKKPTKSCPFYKKIPGTRFAVDAFKYGKICDVKFYLLTHFHYDHYGGLTNKWSNGYIICTPVTAKLIHSCIGSNASKWIRPFELNTPHVIDGIEFTFMDANHCPGSVIVLFRYNDGRCILHTGDFRASKAMTRHPILNLNPLVIETLYLDTTYCDPKHVFPSQEEVIDFVIQISKNHLRQNTRTLLAVGSYTIGKEKVFYALAKELNIKIYVEKRKMKILSCLDFPDLNNFLSNNPKFASLHVLPMALMQKNKLDSYLKKFSNSFDSILGFRPTGWTFNQKNGSNLSFNKPEIFGAATIYGVPYSEHSNFNELKEFVQFLRPQKIIPTVNISNAKEREKMQNYFNEWLN